jgi:hypothetical protein
MTVSPQRSWPNLWKMIIDGLDPILGRSFPADQYDPEDGRVVRLGIPCPRGFRGWLGRPVRDPCAAGVSGLAGDGLVRGDERS